MRILAKTGSGSLRRIPRPPWWWGFGLSLVLPVSTFTFLASGPHGPIAALLWTSPVWALTVADRYAPPERRGVPATAPRGFFNGLLYTLTLLQVMNLLVLGVMVSRLSWATGPEIGAGLVNLLAIRILVGTTSCCAAIAPAHELIHRGRRWQRWLGRLLLMTVCYDHFFVAHRAGHHARLGSGEDPSTARPDETYLAFLRRSVCGQWRIAWRAGRRAVLHGLAVELLLLAGFGACFGPLALFMLLYQAVVAVKLLEAVNYFQHYGLTLASGRSGAVAWRHDSAVSLFLFLGLNRHADHHRRPAVPYPELRSLPDGPELPCGYLGMAWWIKNRSKGFRRWAESRELGNELAGGGESS